MKYEVVTLEEKKVVGVSAVTGNSDPNMQAVIGELWNQLFAGGVYQTIKNKANGYTIGLYSDYEQGKATDKVAFASTDIPELSYAVTAGVEVTKAENEELVTKIIPAGKYAKFMLEGNMDTVVADGWEEIWKTELDRTFTGDFEEYLNSDMEHTKVAVYIAIK